MHLKKLKELREGGNFTQVQLTEMLGKTQQTIGRWESGKAEPSLANLRDLAVIFGVSTDYLLGKLGASERSAMPFPMGNSETAHHWGDLAIRLPGTEEVKQYPISNSDAEYLLSNLQSTDVEEGAVLFVETMNNRHLIFQPLSMEMIALVPEYGEFPEELGIEETSNAYGAEIYDALDRRLGALYRDEDEEGDGESDTLKAIVDEFIEDHNLHDEEDLIQFLEVTTITLTSGRKVEIAADADEVDELRYTEGTGVKGMLSLANEYSASRVAFPWKNVAMVDSPLAPVIKAHMKHMESYEDDEE